MNVGTREKPLGLSGCSGSLPFLAAARVSELEEKVVWQLPLGSGMENQSAFGGAYSRGFPLALQGQPQDEGFVISRSRVLDDFL